MDKQERQKIYSRKHYNNNKQREIERVKKYNANHKEARAIYDKEYKSSPNGKKVNMISHWKSIGIIDEDLDAVYDYYVKETNCMICLKEYKNSSDRCLDHDHESGEIRYICCQYCNLYVVG